ncbi:MAG: hypothetical protein SFW09_23185 [Hyphomicrobiaceae bacterium]|nr:hypothetical protein [Hyphomicrobiaceae bacterium]
MAEQPDKLAISPRSIDTGSGVIQMAHVTSATYGTGYPFRIVGLGLIGLAIALVGSELLRGGTGAFALKSGGSPMLWLAFGAAGIGLFLTVFAQRFLLIRTVDGARVRVAARDDQAAAAIIGRIREAMEAGSPSLPTSRHAGDALPHAAKGAPIGIPMQEPALQPRTGPPRTMPAGLPHSGPPRDAMVHDPHGGHLPTTQPVGQSRRAEGYVNGANGAQGHAEGGYPAAGANPRRALAEYVPPRMQAERPLFGTGAGLPQGEQAHAGSLEHRLQQQGMREPLALPSAAPLPIPRDDPVGDLHQLMEHVRHADVQHKEALLDLLRVVDDHYMGRASREDAVSHWRSFADYAAQYLGGVDGLMGLTERFGRHMVPR